MNLRHSLILMAVSLLPITLHAAPPTDNPLATHYGSTSGYPAWTDEIQWDNAIDMSTYSNGANDFEKFENARDELAAAGGGVLYYPAGTYDFSDMPASGPNGRGLMLKSGVVIRGETPSTDTDATDGTLNPPTTFVFPTQTLGGGQVPQDWNFIGLEYQTGGRISNVQKIGVAWITLQYGTIYWGPDREWGSTWSTAGGWKSSRAKTAWASRVPDGTHPWDPFAGSPTSGTDYAHGKGRFVFGCVLKDSAVLNNAIKDGTFNQSGDLGESGFYMFKFGARIAVYGSHVFVANNYLPASLNNFTYTQTTAYITNGDVNSPTWGEHTSTVLWDYGKTCGIDVNKELWGAYAADDAAYRAKGIVVRDNWVYNHGHKGYNLSGEWVTIQNNHNERDYLTETIPATYSNLSGNYELTLDGYTESQPGGSGSWSDNLARAIDLSGQALWIDANSYNNLGSDPGNDGEGILCQAHGGTQLNSWALTNNQHLAGGGEPGYMGGYDVMNYGHFSAWNTTQGWVGHTKAESNDLIDCAFVANNASGGVRTEYGGVGDFVTSDPAGTLSAPANVTAQALSTDAYHSAEITWEDTTTAEVAFRIDRKIGTSGTWTPIAYRPRKSIGAPQNEQRWIDYTAPTGVDVFYRVAAIDSNDGDTALSTETAAVTLGFSKTLIDPYVDTLPTHSTWETDYQTRLSALINAQSWPIGSGAGDTDQGKRDWPALLAQMWKVQGNTTALNNYITSNGATLINSSQAGRFYKAFSVPGLVKYYLEYKSMLPQSQIDQVADILNQVDPVSGHTEAGTSTNVTGWEQLMRVDGKMDPIYDQTEFNSENFSWMSRLGGLLLAHDQNEADKITYFEGYLDNYIRAMYSAGRVEWNSNNYYAYCVQPLLTLYDHAPTADIKLKAKAALDWMAMEAALHYIDGFQAGPDVRAKPQSYVPFAGSAWSYTYLWFVDANYHPTFSQADAVAHADYRTLGWVGYTDYRPPQAIIDIAQRNFTLPVEMQNAKPFYHLDEENYMDWKADTERSRRYEFETVYYDENYLLGSMATYRPDGLAVLPIGGKAGSSQMMFSEQNLWRFAVKGTNNGAIQVFGNSGPAGGWGSGWDVSVGRQPLEQIGQYRETMMRIVKGLDRMWVAFPDSITVEFVGDTAFADMGNGVYCAVVPHGVTSRADQDFARDNGWHQYIWNVDSASVSALVMEVGTLSQHGSYANFKTAVQNNTSITVPGADQVAYTATSGRELKMQYVAPITYELIDGTVIDPAGTLPRVWRDNDEVDFSTWDAYSVSYGENIAHQEWGSGVVTVGKDQNYVRIEVNPDTAAVTYWQTDRGGFSTGGITTPTLFAPTITASPSDQTVNEDETVSFSVGASANPQPTYQWQRNNGSGWADISNATNTNYGFQTDRNDDGAQFRCVVTNSEGTVNSDAATLTVIPDLTAPQVVQVSSTGTPNLVVVKFDETVSAVTAADTSHYSLDNGATVSSAKLLSDGQTVYLTTSTLNSSTTYTLTTNGVEDLKANVTNSTDSFTPQDFNAVKVDFGSSSSPVAAGYLQDYGQTYAARNGETYGWLSSKTSDYRDGIHADARWDDLIHIRDGVWEISVPNGSYDLEIGCGDPGFIDSINDVLAEGVLSEDPDGNDNFDTYQLSVTVSDGKFTFTNAASHYNSKIAYIDIYPAGTLFGLTGYADWSGSYSWNGETQTAASEDPDSDGLSNFMEYALGTDPLTASTGPTLTLNGNDYQFTFKRERSSVTYTVETSQDLSSWQTHSMNPGTVGQEVNVMISQPSSGNKLFARLVLVE